MDVVYDCIIEAGWSVERTWDGIEVTSDTVPDEQRELYEADIDACWAEIDARVDAMTPDQISDVYEQELSTRECLIEQGLEVEVAPSEQEYSDTFHTTRWSAYGAARVESLGGETWQKLNELCPQPAWSLGVPSGS